MRRRLALVLLALLALLALPVFVAGQPAPEWHDIVSSRRLMRHGVHPTTVQLRTTGERRCLGRNCSFALEVRVVRGELPSQNLRYFFTDTTEHEPGCPFTHRDTLLANWTEAEIAPSRDEDRPSCGVGVTADGIVEDWVILRTRHMPEGAAPAPTPTPAPTPAPSP